MHAQSGETIGVGTAREYFDFARNKAFLDIAGHQGNDFQITDAFWQHLNELTAEYNEDNRFLTLPGYEWSGNTGLGGDHNVWFRDEGRPIYRSSRALISDRTFPENDVLSTPDLIDDTCRRMAMAALPFVGDLRGGRGALSPSERTEHT